MKYIVTVNYRGSVDLKVTAPDQETAEEVALDEIDSWPEQLFFERVDLDIDSIQFENV